MCHGLGTENVLFRPHSLPLRNVLLFPFFKNEGTEVERSYGTCLRLLELVSDGTGARTEICPNLTKPLSVI